MRVITEEEKTKRSVERFCRSRADEDEGITRKIFFLKFCHIEFVVVSTLSVNKCFFQQTF